MIAFRTLPFVSALLMSLIIVSACQIVPSRTTQVDPADNTAMENTDTVPDKVARDFIKALRQIPSLAPASTTVNMLTELRQDDFTQSLNKALDEAGYAVRWSGDPAGKRLLSYRREQEASVANTDRVRFDVALGTVELRRTYLMMDEGGLRPVTPLYVKGADASSIALDDGVFDEQASARSLATLPTLAVSTDVGANPLRSLIPTTLDAKPLTLPLLALPEIQNVFEIGGSNFETRLANHQIVAEQILTFPNDSLRLGKTNKTLIQHMVRRFNAQTDVISLIGCSLGPTRIKGGNAALALGRASRVREALLFSGVSPDKILDEGCWAGDSAGNTLPARGVVITLNRQT